MINSDKKLEYDALIQFVSLVDKEGSVGRRVRKVIQEELTLRQREIINLYFIEQFSMTEIAQMLELNPSTVSRTIVRGKNRIRKYLTYNGRTLVTTFVD